MKKPGISILYFIIGLIQIVLQTHPGSAAGFIAKAMIIPVLIIIFLANIKIQLSLLNWLMLAGLIFSWGGDIMLEWPASEGTMFVPGLVLFLLAHIMYLTVFIKTPGSNFIRKSNALVLLPVFIYGVILIALLYGNLKEMKVPVIIYAAMILLMLSSAVNRKEKVNQKSYWIMLAGAILFVVSDSAIAINKFTYQFSNAGILIMSTYILAQFLIVTGYIYQFRPAEQDKIKSNYF
jgi:uncharacterized membrane protein YhhN